jgi:HAD superfamily phosphoserine phosphatase-like hydrolase
MDCEVEASVNRFDLIAFDVDGTLVNAPGNLTVWEVLNQKFHGSSGMNRDRYQRYLAGQLTYAGWVDLDIKGWIETGAVKDDLLAGFEPLVLIEGAREALTLLKQRGHRLVVISGTLDLMLETLLPDHPFDEVHTNRISFDHKGHISDWRATPYDMQGKAEILRQIAEREQIPVSRCAYVGDSSNDVWIAREAGFTIAINPKSDELEKLADAVVRTNDLRDILPHLLPDL